MHGPRLQKCRPGAKYKKYNMPLPPPIGEVQKSLSGRHFCRPHDKCRPVARALLLPSEGPAPI